MEKQPLLANTLIWWIRCMERAPIILPPKKISFHYYYSCNNCDITNGVSEWSKETVVGQSACPVQQIKRTKLDIVEVVTNESAEERLLVQQLIDLTKQKKLRKLEIYEHCFYKISKIIVNLPWLCFNYL